MQRMLPLQLLASSLALVPGVLAHAVDLSIASVEITQGVQSAAGDLPLVARNATIVRVKVSLNGQLESEPDVDALLRIYSNGIEIPESPVYSTNGPILAVAAPSSDIAGQTIDFHCVPPEGTDLDFVVTVNAFGTVREDSVANNTLGVYDKAFVCRKMVELVYVPVNYLPGGGLPNAAMIEPGSGDAFLRAIYKTGDWNYHRSPLPTYTHASDINVSNIALLNTMNDIRQNQLVAAGYPRPDFVFGWLPGNPYVGNGQALAIPSGAAFGNTDPNRFQRTFAHEIGHCWGQAHNALFCSGTGFDVEHHLRDPLGLSAIMPASKRDVMVPAMNTPDAWCASLTYLDAINDARSACSALDGGEGDGEPPADDAAARGDMYGDVLRLAGEHDHARGQLRLQPTTVHERVQPTPDTPSGNLLVESLDAAGVVLHAVRVETRACRESCAQAGHLHGSTAFYVNLPRLVGGVQAARLRVRELRGAVVGRSLAEVVRSAHAPEITRFEVNAVGGDGAASPSPAPVQHLLGAIRIEWSARDLDGDALSADILYSQDAGFSWFPLVVGETSGAFEFNSAEIPASRGAHGQFAVRVSDGFNTARRGSGSSLVGNSAPPDVHLLTPNNNDSMPFGASVVLHGSAWDIDDQLLPESSVTWESSLDGAIGVGRLLVRRNLTVGTHVLTVRGTDSGGLYSERSVTVTITPRVCNNANLDGTSVVNAFDLMILLSTWGEGGIADIDLDGTVGAGDLAILLWVWGY